MNSLTPNLHPHPAAGKRPRIPRPASAIFEIEVSPNSEVWQPTDNLVVFLAHPGRRLLCGMPYGGPIRSWEVSR